MSGSSGRMQIIMNEAKSSLFLDKEGRWFHEGVEITHRRTSLLFSRNLQRGPDDGYYIELGSERARVEVEDTPYTVKSVTVLNGDGGNPKAYILHLNDETEEFLDPRALTVGKKDVMYCRVKQGAERARILRSAYYQICLQIETNAEENRFWLPCGGGKYPILIRK